MTCTAFRGCCSIATGSIQELSRSLKDERQGDILIFNDSTGYQVELSASREPEIETVTAPTDEPKPRGRPRLGVIAREVTLLPRHWDWLSSQPGGASVALRKLVDQARRASGDRDRIRASQEAAYRFMSAIAGNLPDFEEATRALFAYDRRRFSDLIANWPEDVRDYAVKLAFSDQDPG